MTNIRLYDCHLKFDAFARACYFIAAPMECSCGQQLRAHVWFYQSAMRSGFYNEQGEQQLECPRCGVALPGPRHEELV